MTITHIPHQFLITPFEVRLLIRLIVSGPAVGNVVADDGWIVGDLRTGPSNDKRRLVYMLDVHVDRGTAACCVKDRKNENVCLPLCHHSNLELH